MAYTAQITVSNGADTAITANTACKVIVVTEDPGVAGWPTSDFLIKKGTSAQYIRVKAGQTYAFQSGPSFYQAGKIVGYVKMVSGTTTFDQDEDEP